MCRNSGDSEVEETGLGGGEQGASRRDSQVPPSALALSCCPGSSCYLRVACRNLPLSIRSTSFLREPTLEASVRSQPGIVNKTYSISSFQSLKMAKNK